MEDEIIESDDPFSTQEEKPWKGFRKVKFNHNSSLNRRIPVRIKETGETFPSKKEAYARIAELTKHTFKYVRKEYKEKGSFGGYHLITLKEEKHATQIPY